MKKTLLIAAAALVAATITSEAQVYSANIVGYVNVTPLTGVNNLLANPLDSGTNTLISLFPGVPGASTVSVYSPSGYTVYKFAAGHWKNLVGGAVSDSVLLPPGEGFFFNPAAPGYTNTFVGNVVALSGTSVTNVLGAGSQLVGSAIPYADSVTNTSTINLQAPGATTLNKWNAATQSYVLFKIVGGQWKLNGTVAQVPSVGVAEGFFVNPPSGFNWVESLP
jgi:hypothetical protein